VQIGTAMAIVFGILGVASMSFRIQTMLVNPMLAFIGMFVFFAGQQELAAVRYRYAFGRQEPLDVLPVDQDQYDWPSASPRVGFSGFTWDSGSGRWIEWRNGRPVHTISVG
jgi:hypothetical protein